MVNNKVSKKSTWRKITKLRESSILIIVIFICVLLSIVSPSFLTLANFRTTFLGLTTTSIVAIGMTICLISGGFDLSVGSLVGLTAVITAKLYSNDMNIWISAGIAVIVIGAIGVLNGFLIGKIKLNALITTLATMTIARGACYVITKGTPITLGAKDEVFNWLGKGDFFGIPALVIILIICVVLSDFLIRRLKSARNIFYVGSNEKTATLSGINVKAVKIKVYLVSSLMAALGGMLSLSRFGVASPTLGQGLEMSVISAAVIGGASISGGEGTILGTTLGVILLAFIDSGLVMLDVSIYWQGLISGAVLLIAVLIDNFSNQKRMNRVSN